MKKGEVKASEVGPKALELRAAESERNITAQVAEALRGGGDLRRM